MTDLKPQTLSDAVAMLRQLLRPEELEVVRTARRQDLARFHFNHGEYVRNLWFHRGGSPLTQRIREAGGNIGDGNEFSQLVLEALWYDLNDRPYEVAKSEHYQRMVDSRTDARLGGQL